MPSKLLLVIIIALIVLVVYLVFIYQGRVRYEAVTQEGIEKLTNVGICGISQIPLPSSPLLGIKQKQCSELTNEECEGNLDCILCEREVSGAVVSTCKTRVCGCGFGWEPASGVEITVSVIGEPY